MILQAVDELLRVLEAHTDGNTFWLQFYSVAVEETAVTSPSTAVFDPFIIRAVTLVPK